LGEWRRGVKVGVVSGVICGVFTLIFHFIYFLPKPPIVSPVVEEPVVTVLYLTIMGAITGLLFALAVEALPGKTSTRKALNLSLILWALHFAPGLAYLPTLLLERPIPPSMIFEQLVNWSIIDPTGVISWLVFGVSLGYLWEKLSPKKE